MAMRRATMMRRVTLCGFSSSQSSMYFLIFSLVMFTYFEYCFFSFRLVFNPTSVGSEKADAAHTINGYL